VFEHNVCVKSVLKEEEEENGATNFRMIWFFIEQCIKL
jgi:hypothetical protein